MVQVICSKLGTNIPDISLGSSAAFGCDARRIASTRSCVAACSWCCASESISIAFQARKALWFLRPESDPAALPGLPLLLPSLDALAEREKPRSGDLLPLGSGDLLLLRLRTVPTSDAVAPPRAPNAREINPSACTSSYKAKTPCCGLHLK